MPALPLGSFNRDAGDGGPCRPSLENLGGGLLEDKVGAQPPQDGKHLYADMVNGWQHQMRSVSAMIPTLEIEVRFSAGTPSVYAVKSAKDGVETGDITVTDNGDGDVTLEWPENTIPPTTISPKVHVVGSTFGTGQAEYVTNGVRVYTFNNAAAAADRNFVVTID